MFFFNNYRLKKVNAHLKKNYNDNDNEISLCRRKYITTCKIIILMCDTTNNMT